MAGFGRCARDFLPGPSKMSAFISHPSLRIQSAGFASGNCHRRPVEPNRVVPDFGDRQAVLDLAVVASKLAPQLSRPSQPRTELANASVVMPAYGTAINLHQALLAAGGKRPAVLLQNRFERLPRKSARSTTLISASSTGSWAASRNASIACVARPVRTVAASRARARRAIRLTTGVRRTYQPAMRRSLTGLPRYAGHRIEMRHVDSLRADV